MVGNGRHGGHTEGSDASAAVAAQLIWSISHPSSLLLCFGLKLLTFDVLRFVALSHSGFSFQVHSF